MLAQILSNLIVQSAARIGDDEAAAAEFRRQAQLMIEMGESVAAASPSSAATHFLQAMGVLSKLPDADEEVDRLSRRRHHATGSGGETVLVRPDSHIAARGRGIHRYLAEVFLVLLQAAERADDELA